MEYLRRLLRLAAEAGRTSGAPGAEAIGTAEAQSAVSTAGAEATGAAEAWPTRLVDSGAAISAARAEATGAAENTLSRALFSKLTMLEGEATWKAKIKYKAIDLLPCTVQ